MRSMKRPSTIQGFGKRLATMRKVAGLTQKQLGEKIGVSNRVVHYYETETNHPPAHFIEPLASAFKVSTDELLGIKSVKQQLDTQHAALWRRLKAVETLPKRDQKALLHYLDALTKTNGNNNGRVRETIRRTG